MPAERAREPDMDAADRAAPRSALEGRSWRGPLSRLLDSPAFIAWAARTPGLRRIARREAVAIFDLMAGFVRTQILAGIVETGVLDAVCAGEDDPDALCRRCGVPRDRLAVLLRGAAATGLLRITRAGRVRATRRGRLILAVPGIEGMIRHHGILYGDLADPASFFRGGTEPALAAFWPYVFGGGAGAGQAAAYSRLMTETQTLVAEETLRLVDLRGVRRLLDVGGGSGAFLAAAGRAHPDLELMLFDLPDVLAAADTGGGRISLHAGNFRSDPLPRGADAISLIRVLYDHEDDTVLRLLRAARDALPEGGLLILSEPMSGGDRHPDPITDTYFAVYTLAMRTGRTRAPDEIARLLERAGFTDLRHRPGYRPFIASAITARRPAAGRAPGGAGIAAQTVNLD